MGYLMPCVLLILSPMISHLYLCLGHNIESEKSTIFMSLWSAINDAVVCPPFADDAHVVKNYLLLEMPGYPIDPDIFDEEEFKQNPKAMSPAYATALLVDRVPAFARYFHDTGSQISFYWKQLLQTHTIIGSSVANDSATSAKYNEAIEVHFMEG